MIRFGLRLAVAGGREALVRLATVAAAIAIGVTMLLATVSALHAVTTQSDRYAWMNTRPTPAASAPSTAHPTWWLLRLDYYDGQDIGRLDVAATGPDSPAPPGIPALPGPGQFYASPALAKLLATVPADQLGNRFPGRLAGSISPAGLPSPDSLIIVIGHTVDEMSHTPGARQVDHVRTTSPARCDDCSVGVRADGYELILSVVIAALLFPVLIFIGAATRLSAARREQRFAAMRLVGATPRQVAVISAAESTAAAVLGTIAGFGLFALVRGALAQVAFTGARFYPSDLTLRPIDIACVAIGVPVLAAVAARLALRRVRISPLGVTRQVTPKPPRAWRLIPGAVGLAELAYFVWVGQVPEGGIHQIMVFLPGILVVLAGLVIAGPWFTMVGARLLARRSRRPAGLIAARRLADNPHAAFRAVSGLVVGLFVTTVAVGILATFNAERGDQGGTAQTVMSKWLLQEKRTSVPAPLLADLSTTPGVRAVLVTHQNPRTGGGIMVSNGQVVGQYDGVFSCADIATDPALGSCPPGVAVASAWIDFVGPNNSRVPPAWTATTMTLDQLARQPAAAVVVDTDGSRAALERVRTKLDNAFPDAVNPPSSENDWATDSTKNMTGFRQLAYVVSLASLPIAGCSLAVSVAGGLSERKRPFSLLRLTGVPLRMLRRVVALESAVPLLLVSVVAIGTGLLAAQLFLRAQMKLTLVPPGGAYYVIVAAGLAASLAIIASTLPLLERITGPETARND